LYPVTFDYVSERDRDADIQRDRQTGTELYTYIVFSERESHRPTETDIK